MKQDELIPHLFRTEYSKIVAVLCKLFGIAHVESAEDIASDTFLTAMQTWSYRGIPENPTAWLYAVAKNKARNYLHRDKIFAEKIALQMELQEQSDVVLQIDLSEKNITDSQLQMLFAICHPSIPEEAQIGLALRILCGFGIDEIANAFLTNKDTINKRLFRAKEKLREEKVSIALPSPAELHLRLDAVLTTLYLLFNEGYYSESQNAVLREDLCLEAMRLAYLLLENEETNQPRVRALLALMCFHASRFPARKNANGELVLYADQDASLWNKPLIEKGAWLMKQAARGTEVSKYHLEAGIAYWHTIQTESQEKWEHILQLYNQLLQMAYSPIAALNRTYALSRARGAEEAIVEAEKLQLTNNHYYYTLLGVLYQNTNREKAKKSYEKALALAKTEADKITIRKKIADL